MTSAIFGGREETCLGSIVFLDAWAPRPILRGNARVISVSRRVRSRHTPFWTTHGYHLAQAKGFPRNLESPDTRLSFTQLHQISRILSILRRRISFRIVRPIFRKFVVFFAYGPPAFPGLHQSSIPFSIYPFHLGGFHFGYTPFFFFSFFSCFLVTSCLHDVLRHSVHRFSSIGMTA